MEYSPKVEPKSFFLRWERLAAKMIYEEWIMVAKRYPTEGLAALNSVFQNEKLDLYMAALYENVSGAAAKDAYTGINKLMKKDAILDAAMARILFFVRQFSLTKVTSIRGTAVELMRAAIVEMVEQGLGPLEIARRMVKEGRIQSRKQAIVIARTEVVAAVNFGALEGAKATGLATHKTWRSANQRRTRPDHRTANGQEVEIDSTFTVGGEKMRHPGDPRASAKQVVNCRCVMKFKLKNP